MDRYLSDQIMGVVRNSRLLPLLSVLEIFSAEFTSFASRSILVQQSSKRVCHLVLCNYARGLH